MNSVTSCAALSNAAIEYGLAISQSLEPNQLWQRLYRFNRTPLSDQLLALWPCNTAYLSDVFEGHDNPSTSLFANDWRHSHVQDHWLLFRRSIAARVHPPGASRYKLYVSPRYSHMKCVISKVVEIAHAEKCELLKFASTLQGVVRPDKIILYGDDFPHMFRMATAIARDLIEVPAQGVPFAADLNVSGLLSWAVDPPHSAQDSRTSWRLWMCKSIALIIERLDAIDRHPTLETTKALIREKLKVDPERWTLIGAVPGFLQ